MNTLKSYWEHLITREKALWKSATVWVAAVIASMPTLLDYAQANFPSIANYLPHALQDPVMRAIGLLVFIARLKSLVKLPAPPLPTPSPEATR